MLKSFFPYLSHFKKAGQIGANLTCIIADTLALSQVGGAVALYFIARRDLSYN